MTCRICQNKESNSSYQVREMMLGLKENFNYFQCARCETLQIMDFPASMDRYYPSAYYSFVEYPEQNKKNPFTEYLKKLRNAYAVNGTGFLGQYLYRLQPYPELTHLRQLKIQPDTRILDVGCGAGVLAYHLKNLGFHRVTGIDPYLKEDLHYQNGLSIYKKSLEDIDGQWDLMMFHHSFEHMANPHAILQTVHRLLSENGYCLIRIPTVSSYAWKHYQTDWVQLDAPRHFFLYSLSGMNYLAEQCGFRIENIVFDSTAFQFWGSEQYKLGIHLVAENSYAVCPDKSVFSRRQIKQFEKAAQDLNKKQMGDQAAFFLKKTG